MTPPRARASARLSADVFCAVVDNFGDIGVAWRLVRCLSAFHGWQVRLWVDDLAAFHRLEPGVDVLAQAQSVRGIEVRRWIDPMPSVEPARVVIETFGCALPATFLEAMARTTPAPAWINLEYLSAEPWTATFHARASPHPQLALVKWFFFPGFTEDSGGLLREGDLARRQSSYAADALAQARDWRELGLPPARPGERRASLFAYPRPPLTELMAGLRRDPEARWTLLVPEGVTLSEPVGANVNVALVRIPFLEQDRYDRLLWACDLNFVRGEDSFVRAQWARRPFVWQAYAQEGGSHLVKVDAFVDRFEAALAEPLRAPLRTLFAAWNGSAAPEGALADAFAELWSRHHAWQDGCVRWASDLQQTEDLATRLVNWVAKLLK